MNEIEDSSEEVFFCSYCDKEFDTLKGAECHMNLYCKKNKKSKTIRIPNIKDYVLEIIDGELILIPRQIYVSNSDSDDLKPKFINGINSHEVIEDISKVVSVNVLFDNKFTKLMEGLFGGNTQT